jgi:hypothetical protein
MLLEDDDHWLSFLVVDEEAVWPRPATAEEEAGGLAPEQAVETLGLDGEPPERMYELQWAYAARQRLSARMRLGNAEWALETEWPAARLGARAALPNARQDRFLAHAELAMLHALGVALAGHTLSYKHGLAAKAVWRDFQVPRARGMVIYYELRLRRQADMRRYARDVKQLQPMGLAAHALDLAATMAREESDAMMHMCVLFVLRVSLSL